MQSSLEVMKSITHSHMKTTVSSSTTTPSKPQSSCGSSGIPKLAVTSSGGSVRPKARPISTASTSASLKKVPSTTDKSFRIGESSSSLRVPGKRKLSQASRPKLLNSSAISKREKSDLEDLGSATLNKRATAVIPNKVGVGLFGKRTGLGMHRAAIAPVASVPTASCRRRGDGAPKPQTAMATLNRLEKEKFELEHRVSELVHNAESKKAEVITLRGEIGKLKEQHKSRSETVLLENKSLQAENQLLRDRLEDLGFVPSGQLRGVILLDAEREMHPLNHASKVKCNSAPPSISGNTMNRASPFSCNGSDEVESDGEVLTAGVYIPISDVRGSIEWDKQSSSNVSEVSVACLQDRILQMEETHYSTSEELQATLQELSDLQDQLTELQAENERLAEEKAMFLESLCAKVQQLEECRAQLDAVRHELHVCETFVPERVMGHVCGEGRQATNLQNDVDSEECERLWALLEAERCKVSELMASVGRDASAMNNTTFELEAAHKDRDRFEARSATLQEQLTVSQCEAARLREQLALQQDECTATKRTVGEFEFRLEQALSARDEINTRARELERTCRSHLDERRELRKALAELERRASEESGRAESARRQLEEASVRHARDAEEWRQFQADLLMAVRVANDFKMEAQRDGERLAAEARALLDRVQVLEGENERLAKLAPALKATNSPALQRSTSTSSYDMRQSVKSLIDTIENASKSGIFDVPLTPSSVPCSPTAEKPRPQLILRHADSDFYVKSSSVRPSSADISSSLQKGQSTNAVRPSIRPQRQRNSYAEGTSILIRGNSPTAIERTPLSSKSIGSSVVQTDGCDISSVQVGFKPAAVVSPTPVSILANKSADVNKRSSYGELSNDKKDPLTMLARGGGSRRNALLKWCQNRTIGYKGIDITNFSSSWNDGLALCALVHTYLPSAVPYDTLDAKDKRRNFTIAFQAAESMGIPTLLNINDMISMERPDWQSVMTYVTSIYKHFET